MHNKLLWAAVVYGAASCGPSTDSSDQAEATLGLGGWQTGPTIGYGVSSVDTGNPLGRNVFIGYAGWNIDLGQAQSWVGALYDARLRDLGVRYVFAVQGPADSLYSGLEIGNTKIGEALRNVVTPATGFIALAGHSSGSFVADEFLQQMENGGDPGDAMAGRMSYFNLDGDQRYVDDNGINRLRRAYHVNAFDHATGVSSLNYSVMNSLGATFAGKGGQYEYEASSSGCNVHVCVHVSLINTHPHDPNNGSGIDYGDFASGPVNHWWLGVKAAEAGFGQCATPFVTQGAIEAEYAALGGCTSFLGEPLINETTTPDTNGRFNHFQHGSIYWTFFTGAHEVHGAIRDHWSAMGWELSALGYPTANEAATPDGVGRYGNFEHGAIYFTPATGAHAVTKPIYDAWAFVGFERSPLGYPTADQHLVMGQKQTDFQNGSLVLLADGGIQVSLNAPADAGTGGAGGGVSGAGGGVNGTGGGVGGAGGGVDGAGGGVGGAGGGVGGASGGVSGAGGGVSGAGGGINGSGGGTASDGGGADLGGRRGDSDSAGGGRPGLQAVDGGCSAGGGQAGIALGLVVLTVNRRRMTKRGQPLASMS